MSPTTRRSFLKTGLAAGAMATAGMLPLGAAKRTASDTVVLGRSKVEVTRLAFGTGTNSGAVQAALGQQEFTRVVRYAYDRGIRFFETAESYGDSQQMLAVALKGLPRESYQLMSKVTTDTDANPGQKLDELRRNSDTEYFDIMLLHWQHTPTWPSDTAHWQEAILEAESKKTIRSHGASVHGLPALNRVPDDKWLQVAMIRMNHKGVRMDSPHHDSGEIGNVPDVVAHMKQAKQAGMGVISMKLIGEGVFNHEDRQRAMRFAFKNAGVDCVTVGYKSTAEIDEAIDNLNLAFA